MKGGLVVFSIDHSLMAYEGRKVSTEVVVEVPLKLLYFPFFLFLPFSWVQLHGLNFLYECVHRCMHVYAYVFCNVCVDSHIL